MYNNINNLITIIMKKTDDFLVEENELELFKDVCKRLPSIDFKSYGDGRAYIEYTYANSLYYLGSIFARELTAKRWRNITAI